MLERVAGCIESGSLRRLLPRAKYPFESQRTLHSAFWAHGAGSLDLPPLLGSLILCPASAGGHNDNESKSSGATSIPPLLDFLYPSGVLNFLRQLSSSRRDGQRARPAQNRNRSSGHRLYTSIANVAIKAQTAAEHDTGLDLGGQEEEIKFDSYAEPRTSSQRTKLESDYEEEWQEYENQGVQQRIATAPKLLKSLSRSPRLIDAERAISLFQALSGSNDHELRVAVLRSYLTTGNLPQALATHDTIVQHFKLPEGSEILLAHLISHSEWDQAIEVFSKCQALCVRQSIVDYDIWLDIPSIPHLEDKVLKFDGYLSLKPGTSFGVSRFAVALIYKALISNIGTTSFDFVKSRNLYLALGRRGGDTPARFTSIFNRLLEAKETKLAMQCYRRHRYDRKTQIDARILQQALDISYKYNSVMGMQQALDDWFQFYGRPPLSAYRLCMAKFATFGDVETVHAFWQRYLPLVTRQDGSYSMRTADDLAPLLHVHAVRGELEMVITKFNEIQMYGLKPSIKCWNILINAYSKVHDIDGAFGRFRQLIDTPGLKPDDYTFGTLMGMCVTRGDLSQAMDLYQMAESMGIPRSIAMIDTIVLGHVQEHKLPQAEKICQDALAMTSLGPKTRMWNYLLTGYAMGRNLDALTSTLLKMREAGVEFDGATFAAMMLGFTMVREPSKGLQLLKEVLPASGIQATAFHYAIVMGGFVATGEVEKVFSLLRRMKKRNVKGTISTDSMNLRATVLADTQTAYKDGHLPSLEDAQNLFYNLISSIDEQGIVSTKRKAIGKQPLDLALYSAHYDLMLFVMGKSKMFNKVEELYQKYNKSLPGKHAGRPPGKILSAMMVTYESQHENDLVQKCWDLSFSLAKERGSAISISDQVHTTPEILYTHQLDLVKALSIHMLSLARQGKLMELSKTVGEVESSGFVLDNTCWNIYIQLLAKSRRYKLAFELCESKLMPGWSGWARLRRERPERNRLRLDLRHRRHDPRFRRPLAATLMYLAKGLLELEARVSESMTAMTILTDLESRCPTTIVALRNMKRTGEQLEHEIMDT